jgi:hypothetical protein
MVTAAEQSNEMPERVFTMSEVDFFVACPLNFSLPRQPDRAIQLWLLFLLC